MKWYTDTPPLRTIDTNPDHAELARSHETQAFAAMLAAASLMSGGEPAGESAVHDSRGNRTAATDLQRMIGEMQCMMTDLRRIEPHGQNEDVRACLDRMQETMQLMNRLRESR